MYAVLIEENEYEYNAGWIEHRTLVKSRSKESLLIRRQKALSFSKFQNKQKMLYTELYNDVERPLKFYFT